MASRCWAKWKSIRAFASAEIPASRWRRSAKREQAQRAYTMSRALLPRAWRKWRGPLAARRFRSIETLRFFSLGRILQRFDLGKQTVPAQASLRIRRHWDFWQFRAPAAAFRLASHRGSALCAAGFHRAMMAQLAHAVQRCTGACRLGFLVSRARRVIS